MIDLALAKELAVNGDETDIVPVTRRWLKQVCTEIHVGRKIVRELADNLAALDHEPSAS